MGVGFLALLVDIKGERPFKRDADGGERVTREELAGAVMEYGDTVFRASYSVLGNREDAEDVMQETFLRLMGSGKAFESRDHLRFWLIRVAVNEAKRSLRWYRRVTPLTELGDIPFETPEESGLFEAVMALPEKYRVPIYLFYYEDLTTAEIARVVKCPVSTIQTRLSRAREQLKKSLQEDAL